MKRIISYCLELVRNSTLTYILLIASMVLSSSLFWFIPSKELSAYDEGSDQAMYSQMRVMCYTNDLDSIKAYYTEVLELNIVESWSSGVMFEIGNNVIEYFKGSSSPMTFLVSIEVNDVDELWDRMRSHMDWVSFDIRDNPWGDRSFGLKDPNGSQIIFFSKH
jgi:hypothetical protein